MYFRKKEINSLVVDYQNGDELALDDLFKVVNPLIEKASYDLEHLVTDVTKFDCRIIYKVKKLADNFSQGKHDFVSAVKAVISQEKSDFIKRRTKHLDEVSMNKMEAQDDEMEQGYQFRDPSNNVEEEIILKEKITLLAQGDQRKNMVLLEWSKGANDKAISELLAQSFGGKAESHRKFITRFKTECCELLSA